MLIAPGPRSPNTKHRPYLLCWVQHHSLAKVCPTCPRPRPAQDPPVACITPHPTTCSSALLLRRPPPGPPFPPTPSASSSPFPGRAGTGSPAACLPQDLTTCYCSGHTLDVTISHVPPPTRKPQQDPIGQKPHGVQRGCETPGGQAASGSRGWSQHDAPGPVLRSASEAPPRTPHRPRCHLSFPMRMWHLTPLLSSLWQKSSSGSTGPDGCVCVSALATK